MTGRLAWTLCAVAAAGMAIAILLLVLGRDSRLESLFGSLAADLTFAVAVLAFPLVGALIAARHPRNPIGWLFLAMGLVTAVLEATRGYAALSSLAATPFPGAGLATWAQLWVWVPGVVLLGAMLAIVPDGRLLSPRWRPLPWIGVAGGLLQSVGYAFAPGPIRDFPPEVNPLAAAAELGPLLEAIDYAGSLLTQGFVVGAAVALAIRLRRSRGVQRQQLKWVAYAGATVGIALMLERAAYGTELAPLASALAGAAVGLFPVAVGIAVLRYRLYDIDVIINRTLVYGALSLSLALTYVAAVVLFQTALRPLTGGSELAVAGSTLATLALVQPLRRRIQQGVDRRFYRSRYDAASTLDALSARLRDEVHLDAVRADVLDAVGRTLQPAHAGLWLRGAPRNDLRTPRE